MRYYKIDIDGRDPYTSFVNGRNDPGALNVELNIPVAPFAVPMGGAFCRIWGIPLQDIAQSADLNNKNISIYGGMQKGLPLANPAQSGLIANGSILQAFGNWVGTDQTLDLILGPPLGSSAKPANISHNWQKGQPLATAVQSTLSTAFPGYTISVNISDKLKLNYNDVGFYQSIGQYAEYLKAISLKILGSDSYQGVNVTQKDTTITVYDGSQQQMTRDIAFQDLVGQPTWIGLNTIQAKCVMRADIGIGDTVTLPQSLITSTAQSFSQFRQSSAFQGTFTVVQLVHYGNFRQSDAASWVTTIDVAKNG